MKRYRSDDADRPKRYAPRSMSELVPRLMASRGYARLLSSDDFQEAWREAAGALSDHTRVGSMRRGILEIVVGNSVMMQELTFRKRPLLQSIQKQLPEKNIRDLRFTIGSIS